MTSKTTNFPRKIKILSDDTILELVEEILDKGKKPSVRQALYVYIKAEVKKGLTVTLLLSQIESFLQDSRAIVLE